MQSVAPLLVTPTADPPFDGKTSAMRVQLSLALGRRDALPHGRLTNVDAMRSTGRRRPTCRDRSAPSALARGVNEARPMTAVSRRRPLKRLGHEAQLLAGVTVPYEA